MTQPDTEVRLKITHIHNVSYRGESFEAWIMFVDGIYNATFRHESDLNMFLDCFKARVSGKIVLEQVYRDP